MPAIARNGISGLALRIAAIAVAAIMFGCAPKVAVGAPDTLAQLDISKS